MAQAFVQPSSRWNGRVSNADVSAACFVVVLPMSDQEI